MAPVWGREALAGERLGHGLGRCRRVGPPVTRPAPGPQALGAEAKPRGWQGARVDSAPTAAPACRVGASGAPSASPGDGDQASGVWASAAPAVEAEAAPETGQALGTPRTVLLWLLPAWRTIRERATTTVGHALAQGHKRGGRRSTLRGNARCPSVGGACGPGPRRPALRA